MALVIGVLVTPWWSLAACGSADNPRAPVSSHSAKARKAQHPAVAAQPGQEDPADMVAAVSATKVGPPVEMKFALQQRPEVGQPVDVSIAMISRSAALDSFSASFQAGEGLDIVDGAQAPPVDKPAAGMPVRHIVRIIPKRNGIFMLTAIVAVEAANQHSTRTFSIPVIAGEGLAEPAARSGDGSATSPVRPEATKG